MKKVVILMLASILLLTGCVGQKQYELANYQGQLNEDEEKSDYNKELFYRNDKKTDGADPFILDNTERDGYYYQYITEGSLFCYRSKNMMDWEPVRNTLANLEYAEDGSQTEFRRVVYTDIWAPEVVYDEETKIYYMFFSATPAADNTIEVGKNGVEEGNATRIMYLATSQYPDREFELINFRDANSCGEENLHTYDEKKYPHYYAKYCFLDCSENRSFEEANGGTRTQGYGGYISTIDPHPYVDDDGQKYLLWTDERKADRLCGVKMINWLKPDWSTATVLLRHSYYSIEEYEQEVSGGKTADKVSYELPNIPTNEGPQITKHNGKYYLTFSVNTYKDNSYQVAQAVSDNILGPYRKLTEAEGGLLISGQRAGSHELSGTGHHTMMMLGEKMYMVYHVHDDFMVGGGPRYAAIDEVKWITIKDKFGKDLDVMYVNGPTCTVQPKLDAFAEYVNIAGDAKVSGTKDAKYLNDGLLSTFKFADSAFMEYIPETLIEETTTFTFDFESPRKVRAVMVYDSKMEMTAFRKVSRIELVCEENGKEKTYFIKDLQLTKENYTTNEIDDSLYYIKPGASIYAEFKELNVKSIRVTVEVPKGQNSVGISEVRILGK